jgi:hypothetical protein
MADRIVPSSLSKRVKALLINILIFYGALWWASAFWLPTGGLESVWFLSALALWFFSLLSAPYFVPPRDALANAIVATCILVTADTSSAGPLKSQLDIIRWVAVGYSILVTTLSLTALFLYDRNKASVSGRLFYRLAGVLGKGEILYTFPAVISIIGAYHQTPLTVAWLLILWTIFIIARPAELMMTVYRRWTEDQSSEVRTPSVGVIERIDYPNILRVRLNQTSTWKPGTLHIAATSNGEQQYVLALFSQVQGAEVMATGLCIAIVSDPLTVASGQVVLSHDADKATEFIANLSGMKGAELIGFTVENSTIGLLRFEVSAICDLSEGDVVFARVLGREVFYQILDAQTAEESFDQNPRGTHIVNAAQLGCYDPATGFTKFPWLPSMNAPLFWAKNLKFAPPKLSEKEFVIGDLPSTNIGVAANIDELVEYHTAILGVTGTGKTELALDIVREAIGQDVKVFCVDFTGEYKARLEDLKPIFPTLSAQQSADLEAKLFDVETGNFGAKEEKKALNASMKQVKATVVAQMEAFLLSNEQRLAILELTDIANSKASLRLTEQYLSAIMTWARANRQARKIMIVLEEAHTIIPETFGSGFDGDTQWVVSRIGQIALQGRKYGVGLMVISQRTALVSKTILSQCNTFLTHSLIDQTSLSFLESVYSTQHSRTIPNLGRFEFLAFGKAIRAERPILLKRPFNQDKKDASDRLRRPLKAEMKEATKAATAAEAAPAEVFTDPE